MEMRRCRKILAAVLAALIVAPFALHARRAIACGPFFPRAVFVYRVHPDFPLENFARGEIGVLQPTYARSYLVVAYRYLTGAGLNSDEQKAAVELWRERMYLSQQQPEDDAIAAWTTARARVPGIDPGPKVDENSTTIQVSEKNYNYFRNCNANSFLTASETLSARIKQFGAESPEVKDWVKAQDAVYGACIGGNSIPGLAMSSFPPIVQADRAYQIASANFYARNFDAAEKMYRDIAADSRSPWKTIAPYMVARCLIRKATLGAEQDKVDPTDLAKAENQLQNVLRDPKLASIHPAAQRLMGYIEFRLHPDQRLHELAHDLMKQTQDRSFKQNICDYTLLLDQYEPKDDRAPSAETNKDDLTDWVFTFQTGGHAAMAHSVEKWRQTHSNAWLLAALANASPKDSTLAELITAVRGIKEASPGYGMAVYHRVRLMAVSGEQAAARRLLDTVFALGSPGLPRSSVNLLTAEKMRLAANLDDFLTLAVRKPSGTTLDENDMEIPSEEGGVSQPNKNAGGNPNVLAEDAASILNQALPSDLLSQAASSKSLPPSIQKDVALATWVRAVLLADDKVGKQMAARLQTQIPEMNEGLANYLAAPTPEGRKFAAVLLMLKNPGCRPYISGGLGRQTPLADIDDYRDNWWCAFLPGIDPGLPNYRKIEAAASDDKTKKPRRTGPASPAFLTPTQKEVAALEWKRLSAVATGPDFLPASVVEFAEKNPDDPRVPEALALAVKSTRFGCTDKQTVQFSKAAFDLLHKRYAATTWAKQTKYWYGNN